MTEERIALKQLLDKGSDAECVFRLKPITNSGASRSPIPAEADQ